MQHKPYISSTVYLPSTLEWMFMTFNASLKLPFCTRQTILQWRAVTSSLFSCRTTANMKTKKTLSNNAKNNENNWLLGMFLKENLLYVNWGNRISIGSKYRRKKISSQCRSLAKADEKKDIDIGTKKKSISVDPYTELTGVWFLRLDIGCLMKVIEKKHCFF